MSDIIPVWTEVEFLDPTHWDDCGMDWSDPDPMKPVYLRALYKAILERFYAIDGYASFARQYSNTSIFDQGWDSHHLFSIDWIDYIRSSVRYILEQAYFIGDLPPNSDSVWGTDEPIYGVWPGTYMYWKDRNLQYLGLPAGFPLWDIRSKNFFKAAKYFLDLCVMFAAQGTITWDSHVMPSYNPIAYEVDNYSDYFNALLDNAVVDELSNDIWMGNPSTVFEIGTRFNRHVATNIKYQPRDYVVGHDLYVEASSDVSWLGVPIPEENVRYADFSGTGIPDGVCRAIGRAKTRNEVVDEATRLGVEIDEVEAKLPIGGDTITPPSSWPVWEPESYADHPTYCFSFAGVYANYNVAGGFQFSDDATRTDLKPGELVDYEDPE